MFHLSFPLKHKKKQRPHSEDLKTQNSLPEYNANF